MYVSPIVRTSGQMLAEEQGRRFYHAAECCTAVPEQCTEEYTLSQDWKFSTQVWKFLTPILMP